MVREFRLKHIVGDGFGVPGRIAVENESGFEINELADEPRRSNPVNFGPGPREPRLADELFCSQRWCGFRPGVPQTGGAFQEHLGVVRSWTVEKVYPSDLFELAAQPFQVNRERLAGAFPVLSDQVP